jgi:hypothetical protein
VKESSIINVADLTKQKVFKNAVIKNCIITIKNSKPTNNTIKVYYPNIPEDLFNKYNWKWPQNKVDEKLGFSLKLSLISSKKTLCDKIREKSWLLEDHYYVTFGLRSSSKTKGGGGKERLITTNKTDLNAKPYLEGREINRYLKFPKGNLIRYLPEQMYSPRSPELFETQKIISRTMLSNAKIVATYDENNFFVEQSLLCIIPHGILTEKRFDSIYSLKFILGIINSNVTSFYFSSYIIDYSLGGGLIHATPGSQGKLPFPKIDLSNKKDKSHHDQMVTYVNTMLELNKKLPTVKTEHEQTVIQRQIDATDRKIDSLVYELYDLTEEEIKIVENSINS